MTREEIVALVKKKYEWLHRKKFSTLCTAAEVLDLYQYLDEGVTSRLGRPLKGIVEIGSYKGGMLYLLSHFVEKGGTIISVDLGKDVIGGVKGQNHLPKLKRMIAYLNERGYNAHLCLGRSDAQLGKVQRLAKGKTIDLLHIDGGHDYETVKHDFTNYSPLVGPDGVVFLHDVNSVTCTVPRYWQELKKELPIGKAFAFSDAKPGMGVVNP